MRLRHVDQSCQRVQPGGDVVANGGSCGARHQRRQALVFSLAQQFRGVMLHVNFVAEMDGHDQPSFLGVTTAVPMTAASAIPAVVVGKPRAWCRWMISKGKTSPVPK